MTLILLEGTTLPVAADFGMELTAPNSLTISSGVTVGFRDPQFFINGEEFDAFSFVPGIKGDWKMRFSYPASAQGANITQVSIAYYKEDCRNG